MRRKSARIFFFLLASVGIFSKFKFYLERNFYSYASHISTRWSKGRSFEKKKQPCCKFSGIYVVTSEKKKKKVSKIILRIIITDFYVEVIVTKNVSGIFGRVKALSVLPTLLHTSYAIHYGSLVLRYLETFSLS